MVVFIGDPEDLGFLVFISLLFVVLFLSNYLI